MRGAGVLVISHCDSIGVLLAHAWVQRHQAVEMGGTDCVCVVKWVGRPAGQATTVAEERKEVGRGGGGL